MDPRCVDTVLSLLHVVADFLSPSRGGLLLSTPERVSTSYSRANEPARTPEDIPRTIATVPILPSLLALQNCQNLFRIPIRQPDTFVTVQLRQFEPRRFPRASPPSFLQSRSSGIRKKNQLSFLFYSLVNLRKLCIRSCEHTCDLFVRHVRYVNPLLEYLHLESDSYWPLDPSFLDTISIYSNLRHLSLIRLELPEAASSSSPSPSTVLRFPNLTSLELGGDLTPLAVQDLFSRCSPTSYSTRRGLRRRRMVPERHSSNPRQGGGT